MTWWTLPAGQKRLDQDRGLLASRHPGLHIAVVRDHVEANGTIEVTVGESEIVLRYAIHLLFPEDYPESPPAAYDAGNGIPYTGDRHFFTNGRCCLWVDVAPKWSSLDPDALLDFLDEHVALFYVRQWLFDQGHGWTGPVYSHGWYAYIEYAIEQRVTFEELKALVPAIRGWDDGLRPCPCGSGTRYWFCHREFVRSFDRADAVALDGFLAWLEAERSSTKVVGNVPPFGCPMGKQRDTSRSARRSRSSHG